MNSLSQTSPNGLRHNNGFNQASMAAREISVNSYESLDAGLTIQTREGDVVSLSTSQFSELNAYEYDSRGEVSGEGGSMSASYNTREITLSSGELFSFSVKGDLNEEELKDIESIVAGIDGIIGEMAQGDMDEAVSKALSMGTYDSISKYEADIQIQRSYAVSAQTRSTSYGSGRKNGYGNMPALESGRGGGLEKASEPVSFIDKVAQLLEQQKEESVARARQPLSKLFDHHLNALAEQENTEDDTSDVTEQPGYKALESAAKDVDQLINDMVREIFKDTLDQMI